jgi:hypothetical protein
MLIITNKRAFGSLKSRFDLAEVTTHVHALSTKIKRSSVEILALDDKIFAPKDNLVANGFERLVAKSGIEAMEEVDKYPILLVDLKGTGWNIGAQDQGLHIATQAKIRNPNQFVVTFTAEDENDPLVVTAKERSDAFLKKGSTIEKWCETIDKGIELTIDPIIAWNKTRMKLEACDIPIYKIAIAEHYYVLSILNKEKFDWSKLRNSLPITAKGIIEELVASGIFELLKIALTR